MESQIKKYKAQRQLFEKYYFRLHEHIYNKLKHAEFDLGALSGILRIKSGTDWSCRGNLPCDEYYIRNSIGGSGRFAWKEKEHGFEQDLHCVILYDYAFCAELLVFRAGVYGAGAGQ